MRVSAPASSANLGSGFDALGMALDVPFVLADEPADGLLAADEHHPAYVAFVAAGDAERDADLWWRSPIPPGRGMGFSGAARVAGAFLARMRAGDDTATARQRAFEVATELEQHADNAAASAFGGVVVTAAGLAVPVDVALDLDVVVWWPTTEVSTRAARAALSAQVSMDDAVFNVGRVALLVAALAAGDRAALRAATEDRLHQAARLQLSPGSAAALDALRSLPDVAAAWLSGSGPTVAALVDRGRGERVVATLPADGTARVVGVDTTGVRVVESTKGSGEVFP